MSSWLAILTLLLYLKLLPMITNVVIKSIAGSRYQAHHHLRPTASRGKAIHFLFLFLHFYKALDSAPSTTRQWWFPFSIRQSAMQPQNVIRLLHGLYMWEKWKKMGGRQNKTKWRFALPIIEPRFREYYFFKRHLAFMQSEQKRYAPCIWSNFVYASLLFDNVLVCWCCGIAEISLPSFSIKLSMRQICMHATTLLNIMILRSAFWNLRYFRIQCGGIQRMSHKRSPKTNELIAT